MSRSDAQRVADMLDAAVELEQIVRRGHTEFSSDQILQRASERLLEIIGERQTRSIPRQQTTAPTSRGRTSLAFESSSPTTITESTRSRSGLPDSGEQPRAPRPADGRRGDHPSGPRSAQV